MQESSPGRQSWEKEEANSILSAGGTTERMMKKKNIKTELIKLGKAENREKAKEQGFYDGRYRSRVVPDKKKKASKEAARKKGIDLEEGK